jgi:predicted DCC family thiol-disulfide oxidoreductase YuxK
VKRPVTVLFDDDCGFCRWSIDRIRRLDRRGRLALAPIQSADGAWLLRELPPDRRLATMHAVTPDGRVWSGGEAVRVTMAQLPGGILPSRLAAAFPELTDRLYRSVAGNRELFGKWLGHDACNVDRAARDEP